MMPAVAKALFAVLFGTSGYWLWRTSNAWRAKGEIPAIWNDEGVPVSSTEKGFAGFIAWQKFMAALVWFFCALCIGSIILSDILGLY